MTAGPFAKARTTDLIVQEMGEETLVFDRRTDVAHCLTASASAVWMLCDGDTSREQLIAAVAAIEPLHAEATVDAALAQLAEKNLLVDGMSRRGAIQKMAKYGVGAVAVPLVLSVTAPVALAGQSNADGTPCTPTSPGLNPDCKSGTCGPPPAGTGVTGNFCGTCAPTGTNIDSGCGTSGAKDQVVNSVACCSGKCKRSNAGSNNNGVCVVA